MVVWLCGFVILRLCGFAALWLRGFVALWLSSVFHFVGVGRRRRRRRREDGTTAQLILENSYRGKSVAVAL